MVKADIEDAKQSLIKSSEMLQASNQCIVSLVQLEKVILPRLFQQFVKNYSLGKFHSSYNIALLSWLGFSEPQNLTPASYIVQEVLSVWAVPFIQDNINWQHIEQAVAGTESLDYSTIYGWLRYQEERSKRAYISPEIVGSFLEDQFVPDSVAHLVDKFSQIEVKCAVYVLTNRLRGKVPIYHPNFSDTIAKWLEVKS
uniref:Uncharacterized protein n=1 Tax=Ciona savignyi TaxID=51511 RepID=H2YV53_CIOSA